MDPALRALVRARAGNRCEYCHLPQQFSELQFHIEHVIPRQHGGPDEAENLALACPDCNLLKGPNLTGMDPRTRRLPDFLTLDGTSGINTLFSAADEFPAGRQSAAVLFPCSTSTNRVVLKFECYFSAFDSSAPPHLHHKRLKTIHKTPSVRDQL